MAKHNKKRNVGVIYEQLVRYMSSCLVEKNLKKYDIASHILREYFKPTSTLYREFRLFSALVNTRVEKETVASRILGEAKLAATKHDRSNLRVEKSKLIKEINHSLNDNTFYSIRVPRYRDYATVQTLLNDWRSGDKADLARVATYEDKVLQSLTSPTSSPESLSEQKTKGVDRLTLHLMYKKFSEKYATTLTPTQKRLLEAYIHCDSNARPLIETMTVIKNRSQRFAQGSATIKENKILNDKARDVIKNIEGLDVCNLTEKNVGRFLMLARYVDLEENGNE